MKKIFKILSVAIVLAAASFSAKAQTVSQEYREAVSKMLAASNMRGLAEETAVINFNTMGLEFTIPTSQVVNEIYDQIWDKLLDNYALLYAKYYTIDELHQLADFYKKPLGEKVNKYNPILNREKLEATKDYMPEILKLIEKYQIFP